AGSGAPRGPVEARRRAPLRGAAPAGPLVPSAAAAPLVAEQLEGAQRRLDLDGQVHLAAALGALLEVDGDLHDLLAAAVGAEVHLHLEAVAAAVDARQVER